MNVADIEIGSLLKLERTQLLAIWPTKFLAAIEPILSCIENNGIFVVLDKMPYPLSNERIGSEFLSDAVTLKVLYRGIVGYIVCYEDNYTKFKKIG